MIRRLQQIVKRVAEHHSVEPSAVGMEVPIDEIDGETEPNEADAQPVDPVVEAEPMPIDHRVAEHLRSLSDRYSRWIDDPARSPIVRERARAAMAGAARRHLMAIGTDRPIGTDHDEARR